MRNCAKKASGASTPEYDGRFGTAVKSLKGPGGGGPLRAGPGRGPGVAAAASGPVRHGVLQLRCMRASRTSPWPERAEERGDAVCAAIRESLAEITRGDGVLSRTSDETCALSSAIHEGP